MMESKPVLVSCNFIVDATNGNGLGIRSLKGALVQNVFMNTSASITATYNNSINLTGISGGTASLVVGMPVQGTGIPAGAKIASIVSSSAITISAATTGGATTGSVTYQGLGNSPQNSNIQVANPNPAAGYIVVQFQDNYQRSLSGFNAIVSPVSGSSLLVASATLTVGLPYIITTLGTTTAAQWIQLGVPAGTPAAIGLSFVAAATSATGTGAVMVPAAAGSAICSMETVGDPNQTIAPNPAANQGFGAQMIIRCMKPNTATIQIGTPVNNTVISLNFLLSDSTVSVQGE